MNSTLPVFREPSTGERIFNRIFGFLVGLGLGFSYNYLLEVRGRKSGNLYSTPINLVKVNGKSYLVAPRGRTQWVRNAQAAGEITLKKGSTRQKFHLRPIPEAEKPPILKAYLGYLQTRSSAVLSDSCGLAAGSVCGTDIQLPRIRTACRVILFGQIARK
jgi:deazaflavin-dependent oxidoreductase (nitroreductase family)